MADNTPQQKRQVAYKTTIKAILSGRYVAADGWAPDYVQLPTGKKLSRVHIYATAILRLSEEATNALSIVIDDGTSTITARNFNSIPGFEMVNEGDLVSVIARIRQHNDERYIVPEIIKKVANAAWFTLHKRLLTGAETDTAQESSTPIEIPEEPQKDAQSGQPSITDSIYEAIRKNDTGAGVSVEFLVNSYSGKGNVDAAIKRLLEEGEVFEIKPGKLKVLE